MESAESVQKEPSAEDSLTSEELHSLAEIDSTLYGFFKLGTPDYDKKKALMVKGVKYLEKALVAFHQARKAQSTVGKNKLKSADLDNNIGEKDSHKELYIKIFCKLGHLNLLLEDYCKALYAYQKYFSLMEEHWKNSTFMYGLGLTYMHYNAYKWSIKTFQRILYLDPGFSRSNEIHLRLALMFKLLKEYELSYKHFQLLLVDSNASSMPKVEISYHIAHLYEVQGKHKLAKEGYERLLEQKDLPLKIKAEASKQLGWMYHRIEALSDKPQRQALSLNFLQKSAEADSANGESPEADL